MTTYHYDSLDFNQSGKDNHNVINIGDFIEPVRLAFEGEKSKIILIHLLAISIMMALMIFYC